jgi:hypothetical protein
MKHHPSCSGHEAEPRQPRSPIGSPGDALAEIRYRKSVNRRVHRLGSYGLVARWAAPICAALAGLLTPLAARAEPAPPTLGATIALDAPPECPDETSLRAELDRLLGEARGRGPRLEARARVERLEPKGYTITVSMLREGRASERRLEGEGCATLVEAAALLTAIAHDPSAVAERGATKLDAPAAALPAPPLAAPSSPVLAAPVASPPAVPWRWSPPAQAPPEPASSLGLVVRAGGLFGLGDLPGVGAGVALGLGLSMDAYRAELGFELGLGSADALDARPDAGADFSRIVGVVRGCRHLAPWRSSSRAALRPGRFELSGCLGAELGVLSGEGYGVASPERGSAFWAAPRLDLRPSLGLVGPLSLSAEVGLAIPVDPRRYVIRGADGATALVVHEPGAVAGRTSLGLELRL